MVLIDENDDDGMGSLKKHHAGTRDGLTVWKRGTKETVANEQKRRSNKSVLDLCEHQD